MAANSGQLGEEAVFEFCCATFILLVINFCSCKIAMLPLYPKAAVSGSLN